jgi:pimeloyl-ACP methyl ester carboxylesterase
MIEQYLQPLPHGMTLSCRASGSRGRPVLMFLHGFPEAAFVWDPLLEHFALPQNGGYRCVAPNLRGYEKSSSPQEVEAYRAKFLMQDIAALIAIETGNPAKALSCLVAHDWGGAIAWNLANRNPQMLDRLVIINSPHPGTFLRELKSSPKQQQASANMNFLIRPDAEALLAQADYRRLWEFFTSMGAGPDGFGWLTDEVKTHYRAVWDQGLRGGCNFYRASPLRPPRQGDQQALTLELPREMLTISVPTLVLWGMQDTALPPELIIGLEDYIPQLTLKTVPEASHWIVHEQPRLVMATLASFLLSNK